MQKFISITAACLLSTMAHGQSSRNGMTECAALSLASAAWVDNRQGRQQLISASDNWFFAAVDQARAEGLRDPWDQTDVMAAAKLQDWRSKGGNVVYSAEYRNWTAFCNALADELNLSINAG